MSTQATGTTPAHLPQPDIRVSANQEELAAAAAREFVNTVARLQNTGGIVGGEQPDGIVRIVLTGGGAGVATLREIATLDHAAREQSNSFPIVSIDWEKVYVFFGDERFLPADNPERNDLQATEALLKHVAIPDKHIFRYAHAQPGTPADGPALDKAAAAYAELLDLHAPKGFDLHLLGMGPEGHINSLFPHTEELLTATERVAAVRQCIKPPAERISLTMPAINSARRVWLLVAGAAKRKAVQQVAVRGDVATWPAAGVAGLDETVLWVDQEASP